MCGYFTHYEELALSALISFWYHSVINEDNLVKGNEKWAKKNKGKCYFSVALFMFLNTPTHETKL